MLKDLLGVVLCLFCGFLYIQTQFFGSLCSLSISQQQDDENCALSNDLNKLRRKPSSHPFTHTLDEQSLEDKLFVEGRNFYWELFVFDVTVHEPVESRLAFRNYLDKSPQI